MIVQYDLIFILILLLLLLLFLLTTAVHNSVGIPKSKFTICHPNERQLIHYLKSKIKSCNKVRSKSAILFFDNCARAHNSIIQKEKIVFIYLLIFNLFIVDKFHLILQLDQPSTNSMACLKRLVRSITMRNVVIVDTRHLRQNLSVWW